MPVCGQIGRFSRRDADHPLHEIDARHLLRDAMLDLQARIHFEEVELRRAIVVDELDGTRRSIADRARPAVRALRSNRARVLASRCGAGVSSMTF